MIILVLLENHKNITSFTLMIIIASSETMASVFLITHIFSTFLSKLDKVIVVKKFDMPVLPVRNQQHSRVFFILFSHILSPLFPSRTYADLVWHVQLCHRTKADAVCQNSSKRAFKCSMYHHLRCSSARRDEIDAAARRLANTLSCLEVIYNHKEKRKPI